MESSSSTNFGPPYEVWCKNPSPTGDQKTGIGNSVRKYLADNEDMRMLDIMFLMHDEHGYNLRFVFHGCPGTSSHFVSIDGYRKLANEGYFSFRPNSPTSDAYDGAQWHEINATIDDSLSKGLSNLQIAFRVYDEHRYKAE